MTAEQQKLIQHLLQMGDVTIFNRKKDTIVKAITTMDLEALKLILDEHSTYQDAHKDVFLDKLKEIFDELKLEKLSANAGKCNSTECPNYNKNGVLFCGQNSGNHFNLIIEEDENENVTDLYYCYDFKCDFERKVNKNEKALTLKIYDDEKVDFSPNSHYDYINSTSIKAISDLNNFKNTTISKNELLDWLQAYSDFYDSMSIFNFKYKNEHKFHGYYYNAQLIKKYLIIEEHCSAAVQLYDNLIEGYELNLIKWLAEHEQLKDEILLLPTEFLDKNANRLKTISVNKDLNISIKFDVSTSSIRFQDIIDAHYNVMFNKFTADGLEKQGLSPFADDTEQPISLNYHLEQRNIVVSEIKYKTKLGKNGFLYGNDEFGKMERGRSFEH